MRTFFEWFNGNRENRERPWLILGKGPSFEKRRDFNLTGFNTISLNHAVREQKVRVAHMIDLDVVEMCAGGIDRNADVLLVPWIPHVNNRPGIFNLEQLISRRQILAQLESQGRLLFYNSSTAWRRRGDSPVVRVRLFSVEGALNVLATAGVRTIRSLGVDGGASYSNEFDDIKARTLLANGRSSFDRQFEEVAKTIMENNIDFAPLDIQAPVRVYVAATEAEMLPLRVLEYSIKKHASLTVEVHPLGRVNVPIPIPRDIANRPRTPFSFQRFLIPALAGYTGRAIYMDSDMQVFQDIRRLWTLPFNGADLLAVAEPVTSGRKPQFSVMLLNCDALRWNIAEIVNALDEGRLSYDELMYEMKVANKVGREIDPAWNALERYQEDETALLHYTDMNTQPWVSTENPLGYLWAADLFEAIDRGFITDDEVRAHVDRGHVRPSLIYQIEHRIKDNLLLPKRARLLDKSFVAPYRSLHRHGARPWLSHGTFVRALLRSWYHKTPLFRFERKLKDYLRV